RNTEIPKYRNTEIPKYRNTEIPKYRNTEIPKYRNTGQSRHDVPQFLLDLVSWDALDSARGDVIDSAADFSIPSPCVAVARHAVQQLFRWRKRIIFAEFQRSTGYFFQRLFHNGKYYHTRSDYGKLPLPCYERTQCLAKGQFAVAMTLPT